VEWSGERGGVEWREGWGEELEKGGERGKEGEKEKEERWGEGKGVGVGIGVGE
jgi:hypothetical protein